MKIGKKYHTQIIPMLYDQLIQQPKGSSSLMDICKSCTVPKLQEITKTLTNVEKYLRCLRKADYRREAKTNLCYKSYMKNDQTEMWKMDLSSFTKMTGLCVNFISINNS